MEHQKHILLVLVRNSVPGGVGFLVVPSRKLQDPHGSPLLGLPSKTTVEDEPQPFVRGNSLEKYVDELMGGKLGLPIEAYALEEEIEPVQADMIRPSTLKELRYVAYPIEVWVDPAHRESLRQKFDGQWLTVTEILARNNLLETTAEIFRSLGPRDARIIAERSKPRADQDPKKLGRLMLAELPDGPSMEALASKWFAANKVGVRVLEGKTIDKILDAGNRAFNLRVADPYLRYQQQGVGFTWSFFTHKDSQDIHVHGAPVVEIYGVLEGQLEIWSKPYYDRGTSAWTHHTLNSGDWVEVDSLQCHYVRWIGQGKGVVFKAGPGPLAEEGRLGVKGKTKCDHCPCMQPLEMRRTPESGA